MSVSSVSMWKNRSFVVLLFTTAAVLFGGQVNMFLLPLLLYELTQSSVAMAAMRAMEMLPLLLLGMWVGVIVDRVHKQRFQQLSILIQMLLLIVLFVLLKLGIAYVWTFLLTGFLLSLWNYCFENLRVSMMRLVLPKEALTSANASFTFLSTFITILGPLLGSLLLILASMTNGLLFSIAMFFLALVLSYSLPMKNNDPPVKPQSILLDLKEGWQHLKGNRTLWHMTLFYMVMNGTCGLFSSVLIFHLKDTLILTNTQVGILLMIMGIGGLAGSLLVGKLRKVLGVGKLFGLSIFGTAAGIFAMTGSTPSLVAEGPALFVYGMSTTMMAIVIWSYRQESTPKALIGRITGITGTFFRMISPIFMFSAGFLADWTNTTVCFLAAGVLSGGVVLVYLMHPLRKVV